MSFEFKINGKKATQEDLHKMNQGPVEDSEDQKDMAMGLAALKRIKEMKGQKLPESLEGQLKSVEGSLGEKGISEAEESEEAKELKASLDLLENIKRKKRGEPMKDINVEGLKEEDKKDFLEAQQGLNAIAEKEGEKKKACQNCGKENMMSANFCRSCGSKLEKEEEKKKEEAKITCPKCGNKINADSRFCNKCGEPQIKENKISEKDNPIHPGGKKGMTWQEYQKRKQQIGDLEKFTKIMESDIDLTSKEAVSKAWREAGEEDIPREEDKKAGATNESPASEKQDKSWSETDLEAATKDRGSLLRFLDKIPGIQGSKKFYNPEELKKDVTETLDKLRGIDMTKDRERTMEILQKITNQGEIKLRDRVNRIAIMEKLQGK
jgi:ribosomal protein L40E